MIAHKLKSIDLGSEKIEIFVPSPDAIKANTNQNADRVYWSKVWPASIALSRFLLHHSHFITNKNVIELGAGLGLPSLIAARFAEHVYCTDNAYESIDVVAASAIYHKRTNITCAVVDWGKQQNLPSAEVLLLSDVAYDSSNFDDLYSVILEAISCGTTVILSTPQRLTARTFMEGLMPWCSLQEEFVISENGTEVYTTVFLLQKPI